LSAKKNAIDIDGRRMTTAVGLILTIGSGWEGLNASLK